MVFGSESWLAAMLYCIPKQSHNHRSSP